MIVRFVVLSLTVAQVAIAAPSPQARTAFESGEKALSLDQLPEAEAAYKQAIAASPDYAAALNGLGSVYFKQGKRAEAIAQFKAAIAADPKFALAYFNLGYTARKTSDFATAAQAYETYTTLKPDDADGFYGLGESYRQLGDAAKAIAAYEQYIDREKRPSEQKWIDRAKKTIESLRSELAEKTPAAEPAPAAAAPVAAAPAAAAPAATAPAATAPAAAAPTSPAPASASSGDPARAKIDEGDRFMQQKNFREASLAYQDAVNANPSSVEALFKLGNSYAVLGYYDQAIDRWTRVTQLSTDAGVKKSAEDNITRARAKLGESAPTGIGARQAKAANGVAPGTRAQARGAYEKGVQQINARDYRGAIQSLTQAIQLDPNLSVAYVARGSAQIGLQSFAEAAADYEYAHRISPEMASPLYGMAEAYRVMGRSADARKFYEQYAQSKASDARPELQEQARQKAAQLR